MLTAQIFVDVRPVAGIAPFAREIGAEAEIPREMVLRRIDQQEQRILAALLRDRVRRLVEIERVRVEEFRPERSGVEEILDAGRGLEMPRAEKRTVHRVQRKGLVAAMAQRAGQSALDPARRDARDEISEAPVRPCRESREYIIFREPARTASAFDDERALLAVAGLEVSAVIGGKFQARHRANVEARLVEHHDDVRRLADRARLVGRPREALS